jgi:hypothetical protein
MLGMGVGRAFLVLLLQCNRVGNKGEVTGCTKVLMRGDPTRCRRYVTSRGFWLLLGVIHVTLMMDDFQIVPIISYL